MDNQNKKNNKKQSQKQPSGMGCHSGDNTTDGFSCYGIDLIDAGE